MGLLRLAVLGTPEVVHDESRLTFSLRKALALLLYLAVEGGLHPRSKLAAFLWPDSEPHDARTALRNAIALLRSLLADVSPTGPSHLLSQHDLLGLDPQAPLWLDLDVVQQAYQQVQEISTIPPEEERGALVTTLQHALSLVRGPFLDGFWLGEEAPFDEWHEKQQQQWQIRLQVLFDRLSSWQEAAGEQEQARATLISWLALDPLSEEAYRRLMRLHLARGEPCAALQVYATCRTRLAQALQVEPSPQTVALAEHIRATQTRHPGRPPGPSARAATVESGPPSSLDGPLVGRATAFSQLVSSFQQARGGQPQAVLVMGEAGIGKTRLASEFVAWAQAQGAQVLSGHAFEMGGRLPYQPLVEAIRPRLEEENAPKDLLDDLWLAELSRLLPELRVRYPDLSSPTEDELTAKVRLFEAMARLLDALTQRGPLVLLLDDLQWVDGDSLDLLRYLARYWRGHGTPVLLLGTVRSEELKPQLSSQLVDLGRDLPVTQVTLQSLSHGETLQLVQAIVGAGARGTRSGDEKRQHDPTVPSTAEPEPSPASPLVELSDFLFAHTGGQPFYLLETLKLLRDQQWLVPRLAANGTWKLELTVERAPALAQERAPRELLPASVRTLILARLAKLSPAARQLVLASAVLGTRASAQQLWQLAELEGQAGLEALEEAVKSGILCEEEAGGPGAGRLGSYRFAHELIRDVVYTELGEARRHLLHQRALPHGEHTLELAQAIHDKELEARSLCSLGVIHLFAGDFQEAIHCLQACLPLYTALGHEPLASQELSVAQFLHGVPPNQPLTNRASEALCWGLLAMAQLHDGQVHTSIRSGRRALALSKESKNSWLHVHSITSLTHALLEAGAYEEALLLSQQAVALGRPLPPTLNFQGILIALGRTYHTLQQWEEAQAALQEAEAVAERLDLGPLRVPALSQLCMNCALAGQWEQAYQYAMKAISLRKSSDSALIALDFYRQYETEALLRGGEERQAREAMHRLGQDLGPYQRYRIPYLQSLAVLATWQGQSEQAIGHLQEAAQVAADLGLPGERWQIQATLATLYEAGGQREQAHATFAEAATILQRLAQGIRDEARRSHFLTAPLIQQVLQQARGLTYQVSQDQAQQSRR